MNRLRLYRNKLRMSREKLVDATGVTRCSIRLYETKGKLPRFIYRKALAEFFKVPIEELFPNPQL